MVTLKMLGYTKGDFFTTRLALTLYHTIWTFNDPKEEGFGKHCEKKRKMLVTSIFFFSHSVFLSLSQREIDLLEMINLSSAIALDLVMSKKLSFGKA